MSHWIGTTSPSDAGMNDFKECLKNLRDGQSEEALQHARRALGIAPKNPFYLSYTGLLAALAEKRFGDAESLCREALGMKHNHAQLYLNLAEVYYQAGRTSEAITTLEKGLVSAGRDFRIRRASGKNRRAADAGTYVLTPQPSGESHAGKIASPADRHAQSCLT